MKPLGKKAEMRHIASALNGPGALQFLSFLRANPNAAKTIGELVELQRKDFATAYPGETRERVIRNADWDKAGYGFVAAINEAMGLQGS